MPSRPWSHHAVGLLIAAALLYVGHGLHQGVNSPSVFVSVAHAQEQGPRQLQWELIDQTKSGGYTFRTKAPGGWLVRSTQLHLAGSGGGIGVGLTFVPDPNHKWDGKSLP